VRNKPSRATLRRFPLPGGSLLPERALCDDVTLEVVQCFVGPIVGELVGRALGAPIECRELACTIVTVCFGSTMRVPPCQHGSILTLSSSPVFFSCLLLLSSSRTRRTQPPSPQDTPRMCPPRAACNTFSRRHGLLCNLWRYVKEGVPSASVCAQFYSHVVRQDGPSGTLSCALVTSKSASSRCNVDRVPETLRYVRLLAAVCEHVPLGNDCGYRSEIFFTSSACALACQKHGLPGVLYGFASVTRHSVVMRSQMRKPGCAHGCFTSELSRTTLMHTYHTAFPFVVRPWASLSSHALHALTRPEHPSGLSLLLGLHKCRPWLPSGCV
jgi:hypothetical protein